MTVTMLKGKIHRAVVKQAELNYVGSITSRPGTDGTANIWNMKKCRLWMWKTETVLKLIQ